jgi:hypothetical protein
VDGHLTFSKLVKDVFDRHNPITANCLSDYSLYVNELLQIWTYDDSQADLEEHLTRIFTNNKALKKETIKPMAAEINAIKVNSFS